MSRIFIGVFGEEDRSLSRIGSTVPAAASALLLAVAAGYGAGSILRWRECMNLVAFACLTGAIVAFCRFLAPRARLPERLAALGLLIYLAVTDAWDVLLFVQDATRVVQSVAWLVPLVVAGMVLPKQGAWLTAAGCWMVLFGGVAGLAFNVSHTHSGVGFFTGWLD